MVDLGEDEPMDPQNGPRFSLFYVGFREIRQCIPGGEILENSGSTPGH